MKAALTVPDDLISDALAFTSWTAGKMWNNWIFTETFFYLWSEHRLYVEIALAVCYPPTSTYNTALKKLEVKTSSYTD